MNKINHKWITKNVALICTITFVVVFLCLMAYIKMTYDDSFSRIDTPDSTYTGYLRYSDVDEYKRTKIEFKSGKNVLQGYVYDGENSKGLVVISHGLGFGAENYLAETMYFVGNGWNVFLFDNTGTHQSEGKNTIGPSQSLLDLKAALTYIESDNKFNNLQIMLYGHSWGAYAVSAILDYNFDIVAAASIAGFNSPMELLKEQAYSIVGMFSPLVHPFLWASQSMLFGNTALVTAIEGINSTDIPIMIIHGVKDEVISYSGASIIAHKAAITNPNVIYKTCSEKNHNGHNNLFESDTASEYTKSKNLEYKELYDKYNGKIPDDIRKIYYESVDRFLTSDLDVDFMNEINLFFEMQLR